MSDTSKITFLLENELLREVSEISNTTPKSNQTQVLNSLIYKGLNCEKELERLKMREDYVLLKTLHIMRVLASSRGDEFLQECDANFQEELGAMKEMIFEEGMDYSNG